MLSNEAKLRPGESAPRSGVYMVMHRSHRLSHLALLNEGETLPACKGCGNDVRFELYMRAKHLDADRDFHVVKRAARGARRTG